MNCDQAFNFKACTSVDNITKQCEWRVNTDNNVMTCYQYNPTQCEGNKTSGHETIESICATMQQDCKWKKSIESTNKRNGSCVNTTLKEDQCESPDYILNEQSCKNLARACLWTADKKCINNDLGKDANCSNGQNKYSCRLSQKACAFVEKCEDFDNYTHNCEDHASKLACKQVVFPCGWNDMENLCYWFEDNKRNCSDAANEVACLIADREDQECEWNQTESIETSTCKNVSQQIMEIDSFWKNWTAGGFNDSFIDNYIIEKRKEAELAEQERIKQEQKNASNKVNDTNTTNKTSNEDDDNGNLIGTSILILAAYFIMQ